MGLMTVFGAFDGFDDCVLDLMGLMGLMTGLDEFDAEYILRLTNTNFLICNC